MHEYVERVVDLTPSDSNVILNMSLEEARQRVLEGTPAAVRAIDGSFALVAQRGKTVRLARSLDRPLRYFLAKRAAGPVLIVADRIDAIHAWLKSEGLDAQFHPSYTRMAPAHYVAEIQLLGCPDPAPTYTRFFTPQRDRLSTDLDDIGRAYIGAAADEIVKWLQHLPASAPMRIRTALVTARSAPAHERAIRTLMAWNIQVDEAMFLGGLEKADFLREFEPDFFFDDQTGTCDTAARVGPTGHVVSGVKNELSQ